MRWPFSCHAATVKRSLTQQMFADSSFLSLKDLNFGTWPRGDDDRLLVFHPSDVLNTLPFDAPFAGKRALITAFVELTRAMDVLWRGYSQELDESIELIRPYLNRIYIEYGEVEMRDAIGLACSLSPSSARLVDYAADGIGAWRA